MDLLLLLAIFFGRKFLVLLLGHPIGIVEGPHCPLKRIFGKLAAGKQAGHLTDQFIDVSRCFCSTLLMGFLKPFRNSESSAQLQKPFLQVQPVLIQPQAAFLSAVL